MAEIQEVYRLYGDLIHLPCPVSGRHKPMAMLDRAAQFSPFAALNGYGEAIDEAARYTEHRPLLSEEQKLAMNEQLNLLQAEIKEKPLVRINWFRPDSAKDGGEIITLTDRVRKIAPAEQELFLESGLKLPFHALLSLEKCEESTGSFAAEDEE